MNLAELFEIDYSTFNIFSLNEELKKINKIKETTDLYNHKNWSHKQLREYKELMSYLDKNYPRSSNSFVISDKKKSENKIIRDQKIDEMTIKIVAENCYYFNRKNELLEKINEAKRILLNSSKDKRKDKALADIVCECGALSQRSNISTHRKSKTHLKRMLLCAEINKPVVKTKLTVVEEPADDEDIYIDLETESDSAYESFEEIDNKYFNLPLEPSEYQLENFREFYRVKWNTELFIKKDIEYRRKWNTENTVLLPIYKLDENGLETKEVIGIR